MQNLLSTLLAFLILGTSILPAADDWWNPQWTQRQKITLDTSTEGASVDGVVADTAVLVRLHEGNFPFLAASEDGSDLRFIAEDGKTQLVHHTEKFDSLLNEAFVWVRVPTVAAGAQTSFWLYYGNLEGAERVEDSKGTYDDSTRLVWHFAESGSSPADSSASALKAEGSAVPLGGALIGAGLRLTGQSIITLQPAPAFEWGTDLTWSAWIKPLALQADAVLFSRRDETGAFVIGESNGVPYVEISGASGKQRTSPGAALTVNTWHHLAVVASGGVTTLYLDGESYATLQTGIPALKGPAQLGGDPTSGTAGFTGEIDELQIAATARSAAAIKFQAINQGTTAAAEKLLSHSAAESSEGSHGGLGEALEHVMLFGDIARNMMFDGWIAVGVCVIMIVFGWGVAIQKFNYLNRIQKGSEAFIDQWNKVSSDLTALDHDDPESLKTLGGKVDPETLAKLRSSPIYHLYHIGSEEIRHRIGSGRNRGLSARSIQAIRAALESGLVRENQRMNKGLIFLTISIAGGPYVGLLGTVVGVMITFAIIAKSGEVDVNSIAPGIASALLATVAGLIVAIPALFIYSYLSSRIKDLLASMQVFIDEFIAKMAEFYPASDDGQASGSH
jgi:biopolymer transport protein ExbB